jgi:two-component system cell cycle sensor histidine kinase PleC
MARTWSVPQWENFAAADVFRAGHAAPFKVRSSLGKAHPHRGLLLLLSACLTVGGVAVLNVDSQSLATMLFVAGAGLAATLILLPNQTRTSAAAHTDPDIGRLHAGQRFSELVAATRTPATIDLAAWSKLTAQMSHELRTPLNAVLGFSELMSNEVFGPLGSSHYSAYARDIHASGRMLLKSAEDALAITDLLTSPERKGRPKWSSLKSVADEACAFAHHDLAARGIGIDCDIDASLEIIGDAQALRQMIINLIAEAARMAQSGAALRLQAASSKDRVRLSLCVAGAEARNTPPEEAFTMVLARTLCELSSARLSSSQSRDGLKEWTVDFLPVAQTDLFREPAYRH